MAILANFTLIMMSRTVSPKACLNNFHINKDDITMILINLIPIRSLLLLMCSIEKENLIFEQSFSIIFFSYRGNALG